MIVFRFVVERSNDKILLLVLCYSLELIGFIMSLNAQGNMNTEYF